MNYLKKIVGDRIYLSPKGVSDEEIEKCRYKNER